MKGLDRWVIIKDLETVIDTMRNHDHDELAWIFSFLPNYKINFLHLYYNK